MATIKVESLTKAYRTKRGKQITVLHGIDLAVQKGTIYGFIGPNGAGKSTTIKLMMDFIRPTSGQVFIDSHPSSDPQSRLNIGFLPENPKYYEFLTPHEYLQTVSKLRKKKKTPHDEAMRLLERLDLARAANQPIHTLSKGMTQRLGIALSLVGDPEILILDEPMSGLDPVGRTLVLQLLKELKAAGKTIFFSSHILHDVETICDEIGVLLQGKLRYQGKVQDIHAQTYNQCTILFRPNAGDLTQFKTPWESSVQDNNDGTVSMTLPAPLVTEFLRNNIAGIEVLSILPQHNTLQDFFMELFADRQEEADPQSPAKAENLGC